MSSSKLFLAPMLLAATLATTGAASADDDRRARLAEIDRQLSREVETGRYQGELTRREYRDLQLERGRIVELERQAKSDGYISRKEFKEIRAAQDTAERRIQSETQDGQKSWWRRWLYQTRS